MLNILLKKKGDEEVRFLDEPVAGCWINATDPKNKDIMRLVKYGIPKEFINNSLDPDERPRIDENEGIKLVVLQVPHIEDGDLETITLGVIFTEKYIVTISKKKTRLIDAFMNNPKGFFTTKRTRFSFQLFWMNVKSFLGYLMHIDHSLDDIGEGVGKSFDNKSILNLLQIQKTLTYFKSAAYGNQKVLDKIMHGKFLRLYEQDEDILEDIRIDNNQAIEMISTYLAITANTMAAFGSIISNNMNSLIKILTVFSITLGIPTIIAGLYGMNVSLPLQSHPQAFFIVLLSSLILSIGTFFALLKVRKI